MEQHIDAKIVLLAADKVRSKGISKEGKFTYQQVSLELSHDEYTIVLSDAKVTMHFFFHNTMKADYQRAQDLEAFYQKLTQIAESAA